MTIQAVNTEIRRFLATDTPEILCIRGKWGVGKTYAWNKILRDLAIRKKVAASRYAYVSLFGLSNLREVRAAILESTVSVSATMHKPTIETFLDLIKANEDVEGRSRWRDFGEMLSRRSARTLGSLPYLKQAADALGPSLFLLVQKQIVVFDDIERRGAGLNINDLLGLASLLRSERSCKVVMILNDDQLGDDQEIFKRQFEKSCDLAVTYEPTSEECAEIAIHGSGEVGHIISEFAIKLRITNIRVISRAVKIGARLLELLEGADPRVKREAIKALTVCCWIEFMPTDAPSVEMVEGVLSTQARVLAHMDKTAEELTGQAKDWNDRLEAVGFDHFDEFDHAILIGVRRGYFDAQQIRDLEEGSEKKLAQSDLSNRFRAAWALFHGSLDDNGATVIDSIHEAAVGGGTLIDPGGLTSAFRLLWELDGPDRARRMLAEFISSVSGQADYFALVPGDPIHWSNNEEVRTAFATAYQARRPSLTLRQILVELDQGEYAVERLKIISCSEVEQIISTILTLKGEDLRDALDGIVRLRDCSDPHFKAASAILDEALTIIASRSAINGRRLARRLPGKSER